MDEKSAVRVRVRVRVGSRVGVRVVDSPVPLPALVAKGRLDE